MMLKCLYVQYVSCTGSPALSIVSCLVKIIEKDERIIAAVQFEIKLFDFFYQSKQLTDYIYTVIYCKLSKCIGQTPSSYKHYLDLIISNETCCSMSYSYMITTINNVIMVRLLTC